MAIVKNFNEFDPRKGTSLKEKDQEPEMGNQDANARKAIANLANAELEIQKKVRERIRLAKEWAAATDEERPKLLNQLKELTTEIKKLEALVNKAENEFNLASGVEVLEKTEKVEEPNEAMEDEIKNAVSSTEKEEEEEETPSAIQEAPKVQPIQESPTMVKPIVQTQTIQESQDEEDYLIFKRK